MHWFRYHSKFLCLVWTCFRASCREAQTLKQQKSHYRSNEFRRLHALPVALWHNPLCRPALTQSLTTGVYTVRIHCTPSWQSLWKWRAISEKMSLQWQEITMLQTTKQPRTVKMIMDEGVRPVVVFSSLCVPLCSLHFAVFFCFIFCKSSSY